MLAGLTRFFLVLVLGVISIPGLETARAQTATKTVNVELILDSSGSMAEQLDSGQTRIDAAKQVLTDVINELPEQPKHQRRVPRLRPQGEQHRGRQERELPLDRVESAD